MKTRNLLLMALAIFAFTVNGEARKPKARYVILVSMDGFRHDYPLMYETPVLDEMARNGVSTAMLPSFPQVLTNVL